MKQLFAFFVSLVLCLTVQAQSYTLPAFADISAVVHATHKVYT